MERPGPAAVNVHVNANANANANERGFAHARVGADEDQFDAIASVVVAGADHAAICCVIQAEASLTAA